jgi:hypothetical protein
MALTPVIPATWEAEIRMQFETSSGKYFGEPISKITRAKWTGDMTQVVELLLSKSIALSSNSSPTKRN